MWGMKVCSHPIIPTLKIEAPHCLKPNTTVQ